MKTRIATVSALAVLLGTAAFAGPFEDTIVENLRGLGYDYIEVKTGPGQVKAEAVRGTEKLELVYDRATGEIIRQERGTAEAEYLGRSGVEFDLDDDDFLDDDDDRDDGDRDDDDDDRDDDRDDDDRDDDDRDDDDRDDDDGRDDDDRDDDRGDDDDD